VVVMGDFNDEPFNLSLTNLHATRDPNLALKHAKKWLFNPSWSEVAPPARDPWGDFGSFSFCGTTSHRYLYDQALTSSHFLDRETARAPRVNRVDLAAILGDGPSTRDHTPVELSLP